jgi:hypothetical protein
MPRTPTNRPPEATTDPTANGATEPPALTLDYEGGELATMMEQAARPRVWFIANPGPDSTPPKGAIIHKGYPVKIGGTVVAVERVPSREGPPFPAWVLDVGKGATFPLVVFGAGAQLLRKAHAQYGIAPGDTVAAVCPGKAKSSNVNPETGEVFEYEDWRVLVTKGTGQVPAPGVGADSTGEPF